MSPERFLIAIQARTGSTRMPGKMTRSFYEKKTILELILRELLYRFPAESIVVATSTLTNDDQIESIARLCSVRCARGSETNVLQRVLDATAQAEPEYVVRVCADNPFLRSQFIETLLETCAEQACDYASYALPDGTPTILSHLGLFAEVVRRSTLEAINSVSESSRHREHLTTHILDFPDQYQRRFIPVPSYVANLSFLRLTVDTGADFDLCQRLYAEIVSEFGSRFTPRQMISVIESKPELRQVMAQEIAANEKR